MKIDTSKKENTFSTHHFSAHGEVNIISITMCGAWISHFGTLMHVLLGVPSK